MAKHHSLGGSNAYTWLNCPGSRNAINKAIKEGKIPENNNSKYTEEGSIAHPLGEICLHYGFDIWDFHNKTIPSVIGKTRFKKFIDVKEFKFLNPETEVMTSEYIEAVEIYINYVREQKEKHKDSILLLEESFSLEEYVNDDCGGRADASILIPNKILEIIDYKHGKGVEVEVKGNPQNRVYGLGALLKYQKKYNFKEVKFTIIQPRINHIEGAIRSEIISAKELLSWGRKAVKPAVRLLNSDNPELIAGENQCFWCRVNGICKANAKQNLMLAQKDFAEIDQPGDILLEPKQLTIEEATIIVKNKKRMMAWLNAVETYLETAVESGSIELDDFKLVERISNRQYKSERAIARRLKRLYPNLKIYDEPKIKSPAQMETSLKKECGLKPKQAKELVDKFCERVKIGVALAPLTDGRTQIEPPIKTEFKDKKGGKQEAENFYN